MHLTDNEVLTLIGRLKALNAVAWELTGLVPSKGNGPLLAVLEVLINKTDDLVNRLDQAGEEA